eukprot:XP_016657624.1 PREDICTED: uncharacterized protein LOC107882950 [Acyrthosiphon pisum]
MLVLDTREYPAYRHTASKDDERTFLADCRIRTQGGHRATRLGVLVGPRRRREVHYNKRPTQTGSSLDEARGGCYDARRRLLWHAAAAAAFTGSASVKQRTSLEISLCRRTTITKMLPTSVKPARVFVLESGRRLAGRFGLESFRLQIEVRAVRAGL